MWQIHLRFGHHTPGKYRKSSYIYRGPRSIADLGCGFHALFSVKVLDWGWNAGRLGIGAEDHYITAPGLIIRLREFFFPGA